ncbi:hypothetical protein [Okeania sp. KiyG1]|uniref:hypothetical protein n=1 Tax=Okeania sp. KiyG1 TaxID=2720165 RepID=UPI001922782B|nr:hypothetical protein [Okeania sp. KiyG1]GGA20089.1 hypothetical protein CYANOKiyG1_34920 [Okeania sp. KiyG1]
MDDLNHELNSKIGRMLDSKYFLAFIDKKLKQFRLHSYYDAIYIVVKTREIALEKIVSGEMLDACLKRICLSVIKNLEEKTESEKLVENKTNDFNQEVNSKIYGMLESEYFLAFIDHKLKQHRLDFYYDLMDIVVEAREIALEKIISGEIVENFDAWFRRICFNVIRNLAKKTKSQKFVENKTKEVNREIYRMLKSEYFLAFIDHKLKQYRLDFYYDLMDVVLKAREIALGKIIPGKIVVENFDAWFRKICFNVIRNFAKKTKSGKFAESKLKNKSSLTNPKEDLIYATEPNLKLLGKGWEKLSEVEKVILWLREVEEYSWKEVAKSIADFEELIIKDLDDEKKLVDRVRQKGRRALQKLRDSF